MNNWGSCMGLLIPKASHPNTCHTTLWLKCYAQWELITKQRPKPKCNQKWDLGKTVGAMFWKPPLTSLRYALVSYCSADNHSSAQVERQVSELLPMVARSRWHGQPPSAHHSADMSSCWHLHALNWGKLRLPRKTVTAPNLSSRRVWTMLLGTWCDFWGVLRRDTNWTPWSLWVLFNSAYSMILQNYECNSGINFISCPVGISTHL